MLQDVAQLRSLICRAAKEIRKLDHESQRRVTLKIDSLVSNPRPNGAHKLEGGDGLYRVRVGDF